MDDTLKDSDLIDLRVLFIKALLADIVFYMAVLLNYSNMNYRLELLRNLSMKDLFLRVRV